jgi:hypothetical protein
MSDETSTDLVVLPADIAMNDDVANIVQEFHDERLALEAAEPASTEVVAAPVTDIEQKLGGPEALAALAEMISDPDAQLEDILPADAVQDMVWRALENPASQDAILNDSDVRAEIERRFLFGHSIEDVQGLLEQYDSPADADQEQRLQQRTQDIQAGEDRVQNFQTDFFVAPVDQTIADMGIDASDTEAISDQLMVAQAKFLRANHAEFIQVQGMHERGLVSQARIAQARLANKWQATLIKQLGSLKKGSAPAKAKAAATTDQPAKSTGVDISSDSFMTDFMADFKAERIKRGL